VGLLVEFLLATLGFLRLLGSLVAVDATTDESNNGDQDDNDYDSSAALLDIRVAILELLDVSIRLGVLGSLFGLNAKLNTLSGELSTFGEVLEGLELPFGALQLALLLLSEAVEVSLDGFLNLLRLDFVVLLLAVSNLRIVGADSLNELITLVDNGVLAVGVALESILVRLVIITLISIDSLAGFVLDEESSCRLFGRISGQFLSGLRLLIIVGSLNEDLLNGGSVGRGGSDKSGNGGKLHLLK
jgi:hypothetical protein